MRRAFEGKNRAPFLPVIGASGSGKSSFLRAGLLPRLTLPGEVPEIDLWRRAIVKPTADPFMAVPGSLLADGAIGPELRQGSFKTVNLLATQRAGDESAALAVIGEALDVTARAAKQRKVRDAAAELSGARRRSGRTVA